MTFGQKLYQLRKEKGLSQDQVAEELNTTRQAISKWENDQGIPETENLVKLSNYFHVSIDYLLKQTEENIKTDTHYIDNEQITIFLDTEKKVANRLSLALMFLVLCGVPYFLFKNEPKIFILPIIFLIILSIFFIVSAILKEEKEDDYFKKEKLSLDSNLHNKYTIFIIIGICFCISGAIPFFFEIKHFAQKGVFAEFYPLCVGLIAIGILLIFRFSYILDAYNIIIDNHAYHNKITNRLFKKLNID